MKFDREHLEELTLQKIKEVNDEAGYRSYLEVPEMVNIIASIMGDKFRVEYDDLVNQIHLLWHNELGYQWNYWKLDTIEVVENIYEIHN